MKHSSNLTMDKLRLVIIRKFLTMRAVKFRNNLHIGRRKGKRNLTSFKIELHEFLKGIILSGLANPD